MSYHPVTHYTTTVDYTRFDHNSFMNHSYNGNQESFLSDSAVSHVDQVGLVNVNASPVINAPIHDNDFGIHLF